jgi:K+-transporting ATPase KdpF subunit
MGVGYSRGLYGRYRFAGRCGSSYGAIHLLCAGMRAAEVIKDQRMIGQILLIVICVCLFGYLLAALLFPEKF